MEYIKSVAVSQLDKAIEDPETRELLRYAIKSNDPSALTDKLSTIRKYFWLWKENRVSTFHARIPRDQYANDFSSTSAMLSKNPAFIVLYMYQKDEPKIMTNPFTMYWASEGKDVPYPQSTCILPNGRTVDQAFEMISKSSRLYKTSEQRCITVVTTWGGRPLETEPLTGAPFVPTFGAPSAPTKPASPDANTDQTSRTPSPTDPTTVPVQPGLRRANSDPQIERRATLTPDQESIRANLGLKSTSDLFPEETGEIDLPGRTRRTDAPAVQGASEGRKSVEGTDRNVSKETTVNRSTTATRGADQQDAHSRSRRIEIEDYDFTDSEGENLEDQRKPGKASTPILERAKPLRSRIARPMSTLAEKMEEKMYEEHATSDQAKHLLNVRKRLQEEQLRVQQELDRQLDSEELEKRENKKYREYSSFYQNERDAFFEEKKKAEKKQRKREREEEDRKNCELAEDLMREIEFRLPHMQDAKTEKLFKAEEQEIAALRAQLKTCTKKLGTSDYHLKIIGFAERADTKFKQIVHTTRQKFQTTASQAREFFLDDIIEYPPEPTGNTSVSWATWLWELIKLNLILIIGTLVMLLSIVLMVVPDPIRKKYKNTVVYRSRTDKFMEIILILFKPGYTGPFKTDSKAMASLKDGFWLVGLLGGFKSAMLQRWTASLARLLALRMFAEFLSSFGTRAKNFWEIINAPLNPKLKRVIPVEGAVESPDVDEDYIEDEGEPEAKGDVKKRAQEFRKGQASKREHFTKGVKKSQKNKHDSQDRSVIRGFIHYDKLDPDAMIKVFDRKEGEYVLKALGKISDNGVALLGRSKETKVYVPDRKTGVMRAVNLGAYLHERNALEKLQDNHDEYRDNEYDDVNDYGEYNSDDDYNPYEHIEDVNAIYTEGPEKGETEALGQFEDLPLKKGNEKEKHMAPEKMLSEIKAFVKKEINQVKGQSQQQIQQQTRSQKEAPERELPVCKYHPNCTDFRRRHVRSNLHPGREELPRTKNGKNKGTALEQKSIKQNTPVTGRKEGPEAPQPGSPVIPQGQIQKSLWQIVNEKGEGTTLLRKSAQEFIGNEHWLKDVKPGWKLISPTGQEYPYDEHKWKLKLTHQNKHKDYATLQFTDLTKDGFVKPQLGLPNERARVMYLGYYQGELVSTPGEITALMPEDYAFNHSCTTQKSYCGGVIIQCNTGKIVGMHWYGVDGQHGRNQAFYLN